ncbi:NADP-dependent oxidoreductase [Oceanisphaera arctica]|uniref:NADP-dependent oxidoreductase n=1 Tax=Oceanisphaera arctica TaxID=641510 RepID=A0A2P5TPG6_9GAMM|nr:NADP-dependent oxidoreductase [Oceanisphaera arctica]PPL17571.1 NADP-dependent oxidoreductase [Oceanisphaera arctica]GHA16147.1 NADP-dependent oxidoreductase [Oceanisphaera arctica]
MKQTANSNRQITLASRPVGAPTAANFALQETAIPEPAQGQLLLRTVFLSLDPYMRGRMSDAKSYAEPVAIGETMVGGTVSRVHASQHPDYQVGDWVLSYSGWQDYSLSDGTGLIKLDPKLVPPSYALGVLGMPGFTAYMGLLDIGKPQTGETIVVAAATGAVGSMVAQIGKLKGCNVVAVAGGEEKCRYALETLGVNTCLDHKADDFADQLAKACPNGIDIYYENVGGKVLDAVLPLLNTGARIPVCGLISQYNATALPNGPDRLGQLMGTILIKRLTVKGFIIFDDYAHRYDEFAQDMRQWLSDGKIHYREQIVEELDNAPQAFIGLLQGQNFGKLVVRVGDDELA